MASAVSSERLDQPAEVASKVLRRAQVSKMTRVLQNRLALANVKVKHGWENYNIDTIEPRIDVELKRKRPASSNATLSDTSSSASDRFHPLGAFDSSPLAAPIFSDDVGRSGGGYGSAKRTRYQPDLYRRPVSSNHARTRVRPSSAQAASWKSSYRLPESSPAYRKSRNFSLPQVPSLSFVSEGSTVADEPLSPLLSEDDDADLPVSSFQLNASHLRSSPPPLQSPRTPPPGMSRSGRLRNDTFTATPRNNQNGEEDANLLMYLATSPSPANPGSNKTRIMAPSTPPQKTTPLPSSMMSTPGGGAPFTGFGLHTPGNNLNFADFLNMTPSPAQISGTWNRTPAAGKTPLTARDTRRRLNFDNLLPPTSHSPTVGSLERSKFTKVEAGLGMDLGGELVS
ncbi:Transcription factor Nrm1/Whi5 [Botryosphaeria dothidea]|uniref:Transcription factor Nrm1/Whi5 n=1 Tax=Botryosphaeria dothidea TaxID=55169 RepID=A0A8H4IVH2_9PEZI|nr:Transcription factor Nrm1/Whi5 [Botryosphaeria dothidea]